MSNNTVRKSASEEVLEFFRLWLRNPSGIGAIAPSSRSLAAEIARKIDRERPGVVVELGGGTGRITSALKQHIGNSHDIVVVEREPSLCAVLAARFPDIRVIAGDARDLGDLLAAAGVDHVRDIVSGLPMLTLPRQARRDIIGQSFALLPPDGRFIQFTYGFAPPVPRDIAAQAGIAARRAGWVLGNLPPAAIWLFSHAVAAESAESAEPRHPLRLGADEADNEDRRHAA